MGRAQGEEGAQGVGAQTQKKCGVRRVGVALLFPSPAHIFILFLSLRVSSRVFFSLSGCLLVSFFISLEVFSWTWSSNVLVFAEAPCGLHEKTPGERKKDTEDLGGRRKKKAQNFGRSDRGRSDRGRSDGGRSDRGRSDRGRAVRPRAVRRRAVRRSVGRNRPSHFPNRPRQRGWP